MGSISGITAGRANRPAPRSTGSPCSATIRRSRLGCTNVNRIRFLVIIAVAALVLSACNWQSGGAHVFMLWGSGEDGAATCPLLRFRVELGGHLVTADHPYYGKDLDGTWIYDPSTVESRNISGKVANNGAGRPPNLAPLEVRVDCLNESQEVVGMSHFRGRLVAPSNWTHFEVFNYQPPAGSDACLPPTQGSGVTLCARADGFVLD